MVEVEQGHYVPHKDLLSIYWHYLADLLSFSSKGIIININFSFSIFIESFNRLDGTYVRLLYSISCSPSFQFKKINMPI